MTQDWRDRIPAEDWEIYERAGFGQSFGLGERPALLIIDVQYRTLGDEPLPVLEAIERFSRTSCGEEGWRAVERIAEVLAAARSAGVPVIYPYVAPKSAADAGRSGQKIPSLMEVPEHGYHFPPEVAPGPDDLMIPKRHPSAFFGTPLVSYLIDLGVDTVLLTGCTTSGCVRSTATDATAYNLRCAVLEDSVYDRSRISHDSSLFDLQAKYADVIPSTDVIEYLAGLSSPRAGIAG